MKTERKERKPGLQALAARHGAGFRRAAQRLLGAAIPMPWWLGRAGQNCKLHFPNAKVKRLRVNFSLRGAGWRIAVAWLTAARHEAGAVDRNAVREGGRAQRGVWRDTTMRTRSRIVNR
ncbi:hypothetical protein [Paraburkholderia sp. J76]|uniref:hypothetical protein n=1 Tax=Paraburkholderia sp. J76 TaxID=2805439 RepID=UPI002ABD4C39|nr:hypothetical protein [Paraburkholderia sp. J76]